MYGREELQSSDAVPDLDMENHKLKKRIAELEEENRLLKAANFDLRAHFDTLKEDYDEAKDKLRASKYVLLRVCARKRALSASFAQLRDDLNVAQGFLPDFYYEELKRNERFESRCLALAESLKRSNPTEED